MGSHKRTVGRRTDAELLREYNALFSIPEVQQVMRYLAVKEELVNRHGMKKVKTMAQEQFKKDRNKA